jgi:type II secretory pathway component PulF
MKFNYIAFDGRTKTKKGVLEAANLKEATKLLLSQGWYIKKIVPKGHLRLIGKDFSLGRVSLVEKTLFVKHLGTMIKSGISLNEALEAIADQTTLKKFKNILDEILSKVKTGQTLGDSLSKFPKIFDPLFINIIRIGEESGTLESNLDYLASELEDRVELRRNIQTASFYPAIVLTMTFGLGLILAYFVLPKITKLFKSLNFDLPLSTKILLWVADVMDKYGPFIIFGFIIGLFLLRLLTLQKFAKPAWHWLIIKMPIVGGIVTNYNLAMVTRTLSILLKSGLTIDHAISITTDTTSNVVYQKRLKEILPQVQRGKRLADSLAGIKQGKRRTLFPFLVVKMVGVGEQSGRLDESLAYLAEYFEREVDQTTKNLTTVLEPILLVVVGLIVGFIAISVISPIYQVTAKFNH